MGKRFIVSYASGATGYGRETETDSLKDVFLDCEYYRHQYTAYFSVYDTVTDDFIFRKCTLEFKPEIETIYNMVTRGQARYWKDQQFVRQQAIDYDFETDDDPIGSQQYFRKMARRYGLVREFTENAII